jgi:hypothetical protein
MTILEDPHLSALMAEFESMMDPFLLSYEKLEEVINRSERDGVCSDEVTQAAREEIESRRDELNFLVLKTILLHRKFRAAETLTGSRVA